MLDKNYWNNRYKKRQIGWDLGEVSPPIKVYIDQLTNSNLKILVPGAGNSYEAEYLFNKGFKNVFVLDISLEAIENFKKRVPDFPTSQLINEDFFSHSAKYDLIIEQTFFCALATELRNIYVIKMTELLKPNGKLVGLLFNIPLNNDKPPFGGSKEEYFSLFSPYFTIETMETAYNSIKPRKGNELWVSMIR